MVRAGLEHTGNLTVDEGAQRVARAGTRTGKPWAVSTLRKVAATGCASQVVLLPATATEAAEARKGETTGVVVC